METRWSLLFFTVQDSNLSMNELVKMVHEVIDAK